jgi:AsmA protein
LSLDDLEARAANVDVLGTLRVSDIGGAPSWSGDLEVLAFDPEALLTRLDRPLSARRDPATLSRARGSAHIEGDGSQISAQNLRVLLDDSTITGDVTMTLAEPAEYRFDLTIDRLDADRYLPPADETQPEGVAPVAADVALPTEPLRRLELDGRFSVGALRVAGLDLANVGAELTANDGHGVADSMRASLYGGEFQGRVELDARAEEPRLAVDGTMTTLSLEPLLADLRGIANMTGTGNFDMTLSGTGSSLGSVLDTAQGRVSFSVRDGLLRGFDLGRTMCSAFNATQRLQRPPAAAEPVTRYALMRGSAAVTDGIARTQDLEATTAFLQVTGRGQSDLVSREVNYDLVATLTDSIAIERCESMDRLIGDSVPVRVTGTILEPEIAPDYGQILRNRVRDELQDRLRERLLN